jgi:hypothetical protein
MSSCDESWFALAAEIAAIPGVAARLIALHTADSTGHCAGCVWWDRPRPVYPCAIRQAATRALHIQAIRLAGRVLPIRPDARS